MIELNIRFVYLKEVDRQDWTGSKYEVIPFYFFLINCFWKKFYKRNVHKVWRNIKIDSIFLKVTRGWFEKGETGLSETYAYRITVRKGRFWCSCWKVLIPYDQLIEKFSRVKEKLNKQWVGKRSIQNSYFVCYRLLID